MGLKRKFYKTKIFWVLVLYWTIFTIILSLENKTAAIFFALGWISVYIGAGQIKVW